MILNGNLKNILLAALLIIGFLVYITELKVYLQALSNPYPLYFVFIFSFFLGLFFDIKQGFDRRNAMFVLSTIIVFCVGLLLAVYFRGLYEWFYQYLANDKALFAEMSKVYGDDYIEMIKNKSFGYGACYALGMLLTRLFIRKSLLKLIFYSLALEGDLIKRCSSCNQKLIIE